MSWVDKLEAVGRGTAQGATAGFGEEAVAKLIAAMPTGDAPGTPERNYAAGSAYNDLRDNARAKNEASQQKYPFAYGAGQFAGAAPAAIATSGLASAAAPAALAGRVAAQGLAQGAMGAVQGAGASNANTARGVASDAAKQAGFNSLMGGAAEAAPALAGSAINALKKAGPPAGPQLQLVGASAPVRGVNTATRPRMDRPQLNFSEGAPSTRPPMSEEAAFEEASRFLNPPKSARPPKPSHPGFESVPALSDAEAQYMLDKAIRGGLKHQDADLAALPYDHNKAGLMEVPVTKKTAKYLQKPENVPTKELKTQPKPAANDNYKAGESVVGYKKRKR